MVFEWIFKKRAEKGLNLTDTSFVHVSTLEIWSNYYVENMFKYDNQTQFVVKNNEPHSVNLSFTKLYYITAYKLQVLPSTRYMTGWRIDTSIDGINFSPIDIRDEKLCFSDYIHDFDQEIAIDCLNLTTREFATQKTKFKYLNLVMTKKDSCNNEVNGYQLQLSLFDLFVSPFTDFSSGSLCIIKSLFLYISLLFS